MSFTPVVKSLSSSDETPIHAEFIGDPQKPCLVFIHGLNMSSIVFDGLFYDTSLLREVCMARYDLRGHGRSGVPEDPDAYKSSLYANDFAAVMRAFGLSRPILVTWSYGGSITCDIYANLGADIIAGVVYVAAVPYLAPPIFPDAVRPSMIPLLQTQMHAPDVSSYVRAKSEFADAIWEDGTSIEYRVRLTWLAPAYIQSPQVMQNLLGRSQDPTELLKAVRQGLPLLMLYGDADKMVNCDHIVRQMKAHSTDMTVYAVKGGGHATFYERQEEFARELMRFVTRITSTSKL